MLFRSNLDSIFKSRDITLPTKVHLVKAMVFPVVMYGCVRSSSCLGRKPPRAPQLEETPETPPSSRQLSHPYMTTGKTIALTRWTFVGKVMSLFFNGHSFSSKEQASFNIMAAITICSDFRASKSKVSHCLHCF